MPNTTNMMSTRRRRKPDRNTVASGSPNNSRVSDLGTGSDAISDLQPQRTTQNNNVVENTQAITSNANSSTGSSIVTQQGTAVRGGRTEGRSRIKWTKDMNMEVMRAFYKINQCEDNPRTGYRRLLHEEYSRLRPDLGLTEQNIVDRWKLIITKKYLTSQELENIKREIGYELHQQDIVEQIEDTEAANHPQQIESPTETTSDDEHFFSFTEAPESDPMKEKFYSYLELYRGTIPSSRPHIPILKNVRKATNLVSKMNEILMQHLIECEDFEEILLTLYSAAVTVIEMNGQATYERSQTMNRSNQNQDPAWKTRLEKSINDFRGKADLIGEYLKGTRSTKLKRKVAVLCHQHKINLKSTEAPQKLLELKDSFRQKAKVKGCRLSRYNELSKNIITSINSWAIPVLTYSFGIVKWSNSDLEALDRTTRRMLKKFRCLHPNSSIIRLYLPRKEGGRGLLNINKMCKKQVEKMKINLTRSTDRIITSISRSDKNFTPLNLQAPIITNTSTTIQENVQSWKAMQLHGRYPTSLENTLVDKKSSLQWLKTGHLYPETEGFVMAIQDRVMRTRNYEKHVLKMNVVDKCRKCNAVGESIEHIMAGCSTLSENAYLGRHNQLAKLVHQQLGFKYNLLPKTTPPYYKYEPKAVLENNTHVIYWDRLVNTDTTVAYNRPDIVVLDKINKKAIIIDIAVPLTHNVRSTEVEKVRKYEDLSIQMKQIWHLNEVTTIPLVMSVEGVVTKNFKRNLEKLNITSNIFNAAQKAIILQTCHIVRKFLS
uniref:CSON013850 protein n=1 Tax=Culicoides sonorensis TaxID=179676 RepID=A0A336M9S3_CULSO